MAGRLSRRAIARTVADRLVAGDKSVVKELAALLVETGRLRETELILRDIEAALTSRGIVLASITSAHELDETSKAAIKDYVATFYKADSVELETSVSPELLGGVRIVTADSELDATLARKLTKLKAMKV